MRHALILLAVAACAPRYEWVDDPTSHASEPTPAADEEAPTDGDRAMTHPSLQCSGTTDAVRLRHRMSRYQSIEGFGSRTCIPQPSDP